MLNTILTIMSLFFLLTSPVVAAHEPTSIQLDYDLQKKVLHIEIKHLSQNPRVHRIRKIRIYLNDDLPLELFLTTQTAPSYERADIALKAKEGDHIRVEAYCSEGGWGEATLVIPQTP